MHSVRGHSIFHRLDGRGSQDRFSMQPIPLNEAQRIAIDHHAGPMLVLAGAGSGKTRVITQRIVRLIERGVPARSIVALTFTNKAAAEMAERVHALGRATKNTSVKEATISTFHSFGLSVLTKEKSSRGRHVSGSDGAWSTPGSTFTIFDQGDCLGAIKEIMRNVDHGKRFDVPSVLARISLAKNAFVTPEEYRRRVDASSGGDDYDEIACTVYPKYQTALRNFHAYDFDDLVCEVARLWQSRADVLDRWRDRFRFLLVDEYQDTNGAQLEMLRLLAGPQPNVFVVGDDDQAIYAWRGADVKNILSFEQHFAGAKVIKLEQNYRSRSPVLEVANAVIEKRPDTKHKKVLFTSKAGGDKVRVAVCPTPEVEAAFVARELRSSMKDSNIRPKEMAVLYRSNGQAKLVEDALREQGVPYRVVGGQQFYERKEVKDVLGYLKLALNRFDEISLRRIINYPVRGIGDTSIEKLTSHALAKGWTLWEAIERVDALDGLPSVARDGCQDLERTVADLRKKLLVDRQRASEVARGLCDRLKLREDLDVASGSKTAAARRWGNVESLFATFTTRETREIKAGGDPTGEAGLAAFLRALSLDTSDDEEDKTDRVTLSTLHGAKGLEFDTVFLIGCEEGLLPHSRTIDTKATDARTSLVGRTADSSDGDFASDIEEERRLFYVGITRAKERLTISRCKTRAMRGKLAGRTPCRFLTDVPAEKVDLLEVNEVAPMTTEAMADQANALLAALEALG